MENNIIQEKKCLEIMHIIDILRTRIFEIERLEDYEKYERMLKKLKKEINEIYWEI